MSIKEFSKKVTLKSCLLQAAFIVCLILTGVSVPALAEYENGNREANQTAGRESMDQAVKDAWIKGKLEGVYLFNEHLSPFKIDTEVENGIVDLTGTVDTEIAKDLAGEIARGVDGVRQVNNQLIVENGGTNTRERVAEGRDRNAGGTGSRNREDAGENGFVRWVKDATITAMVKSKLLANGEVSGMKIDVDTRDNRVTLSGEVESDEARQLAEKIAENTENVVDVENNLRVSGAVADIE